jgi:hypothetical protein
MKYFFSSILITLVIPIFAYAEDFELTTDFSNPVGQANGGGGCSGGPSIFRITSNKSDRIFNGQAFVSDQKCDYALPLISINGKAYLLRATTTKREYQEGYFSNYENKEESIKMSVKHIKTITSVLDPETKCADIYRKVAIFLYFKGTTKNFYAIANNGCP